MSPKSSFEIVFHFNSISQGSGNDAYGVYQGQVASDNIGWQPANVGKVFHGVEPQLALLVTVVARRPKTSECLAGLKDRGASILK